MTTCACGQRHKYWHVDILVLSSTRNTVLTETQIISSCESATKNRSTIRGNGMSGSLKTVRMSDHRGCFIRGMEDGKRKL
jgi:hypothetical protein